MAAYAVMRTHGELNAGEAWPRTDGIVAHVSSVRIRRVLRKYCICSSRSVSENESRRQSNSCVRVSMQRTLRIVFQAVGAGRPQNEWTMFPHTYKQHAQMSVCFGISKFTSAASVRAGIYIASWTLRLWEPTWPRCSQTNALAQQFDLRAVNLPLRFRSTSIVRHSWVSRWSIQ